MRNRLFRGGLVLLALNFSGVALADEIEDLEKKIEASWSKLRSLTAKMTMKTDMSAEGFKMVSDSTGTYEFLRKGDAVQFRMEMKTVGTTNVAGNENKTESTQLTVSDGEYDYTLSETNGQKHATRSKSDKDAMNPKAWMSSQKEMYTFKLLPDEKIEGHDCWVIEATPKAPETMGGAGKTTSYYAKEFGMMLKMVSAGADGKPMSTVTMTDLKVNQDISPDRFVFKAPEGVTVQDMNAPTPPDAPENP